MIKRILRATVGVIFFFVFLSFLLVSAMKFRVLSPSFWKTALDKGGVYTQLQNQVEETLSQQRESVKKQGGEAGMPKEMRRLLYIDEELTADRFQELIETNVDRLFNYLDGKNKELLLFLPVKEWDLPVATLGQPALSKLTGQTPVEDVLPLVGMKSEQIKTTIEGLGQVKSVLRYLAVVLAGLLLLTVGIGVGHYFLGEGLVDKVSGTAWLYLISGFVAKLIGLGAGGIFEMIATNSKPPMEPWVADLGRSLVGQFFNLGATLGMVTGVIGLGVVVVVTYLSKQGKIKEEKERVSLKKRIFAFSLGATLGLVVWGTAIAVTVVAFGGKVDFKAGSGSLKVGSQTEPEKILPTGEMKEEGQQLADDIYLSEKGWKINFPAGWVATKDGKWEGVVKKPQGVITNWAMIKIGEIDRLKEVDSGKYIQMMKQGFALGKSFKNAVLFEEPYEETQKDTGWRRFVFTVDFDEVVSQQTTRVRMVMWQYFPTESGSGIVIMGSSPIESWNKYEKIIKESAGTFQVSK